MATISHPRCELCRTHSDGEHCWVHTFRDGDAPEGRMRCRHCPATARPCEACDNGIIRDRLGDESDCPICEGWAAIEEIPGAAVFDN